MSSLRPVSESAKAQEVQVGLAANGSSSMWDIAVDHTIGKPEIWYLQLESRSTYLYFELVHRSAVNQAMDFLERHLATDTSPPGPGAQASEAVTLGRFAQVPVGLLWDGEY